MSIFLGERKRNKAGIYLTKRKMSIEENVTVEKKEQTSIKRHTFSFKKNISFPLVTYLNVNLCENFEAQNLCFFALVL